MTTPPVFYENESPEMLRKKYLNHEAAVRSIGTLYYLGAVVLIFAGVFSLIAKPPSPSLHAAVGIFIIMLAIGYFYVGRGFRLLDPKIKVIGTILAAIGLLSFPIGTLINAYVLYLIHSQKGKMVFSEEYRQVIQATPNIKYKMSLVVVVLLAILVFAILLAGVGLVVSAFTKK
jgi:hypothetical protein